MTILMQRYQKPWDAFDELLEMQDQFNDLLGGRRPGQRATVYPRVNAWRSEDAFVVDASIPGIDPKEVEISVEGNEVVLAGRRAADEESVKVYHKREMQGGDFRRTVSLPFRVDAGKVSATYRNGMLRVHLPRLEQDKPRRVQVEVK